MTMKIQVSNLNNSLTFYRALTGKMPIEIGYDFMKFTHEEKELHLIERKETKSSHALVLTVTKSEMPQVFHRLRFFRKETEIGQPCEVLTTQFNINDPDGNEWIITWDTTSSLVQQARNSTCKLLPINSNIN